MDDTERNLRPSQAARAAKIEPRYYCARSIVESQRPPYGPHAGVMWTSALIRCDGGHDYLQLWNRGAFAGELCLALGDGVVFAAALDLVEVSAEGLPL